MYIRKSVNVWNRKNILELDPPSNWGTRRKGQAKQYCWVLTNWFGMAVVPSSPSSIRFQGHCCLLPTYACLPSYSLFHPPLQSFSSTSLQLPQVVRASSAVALETVIKCCFSLILYDVWYGYIIITYELSVLCFTHSLDARLIAVWKKSWELF